MEEIYLSKSSFFFNSVEVVHLSKLWSLSFSGPDTLSRCRSSETRCGFVMFTSTVSHICFCTKCKYRSFKQTKYVFMRGHRARLCHTCISQIYYPELLTYINLVVTGIFLRVPIPCIMHFEKISALFLNTFLVSWMQI